MEVTRRYSDREIAEARSFNQRIDRILEDEGFSDIRQAFIAGDPRRKRGARQ